MSVYITGQIIYDVDKEKPYIFIEKTKKETEEEIEIKFVLFDGNKEVYSDGEYLSQIFDKKPTSPFRRMYHGKFSLLKLPIGDEKEKMVNEIRDIVKDKKAVKSELNRVKKKIKNEELFVKKFK